MLDVWFVPGTQRATDPWEKRQWTTPFDPPWDAMLPCAGYS